MGKINSKPAVTTGVRRVILGGGHRMMWGQIAGVDALKGHRKLPPRKDESKYKTNSLSREQVTSCFIQRLHHWQVACERKRRGSLAPMDSPLGKHLA